MFPQLVYLLGCTRLFGLALGTCNIRLNCPCVILIYCAFSSQRCTYCVLPSNYKPESLLQLKYKYSSSTITIQLMYKLFMRVSGLIIIKHIKHSIIVAFSWSKYASWNDQRTLISTISFQNTCSIFETKSRDLQPNKFIRTTS